MPPPEPALERVQQDPLEDGHKEVKRLLVRGWPVAAVVAGALILAVAWTVNSLDARPGSGDGPAVGLSRHLATPARPASPTGGTSPSVSATRHLVDPPGQNRSVPSPAPMPSAPALIPVPTITVTHVPKGARTIRFEAHAEHGGPIQVSISDATHKRHDYPALPAPVAFEMPVPSTESDSSAYYTVRVSTPPRRAGSPSDVFCRILVDGIVITSEQGQEYATCSISPYFDIRRT